MNSTPNLQHVTVLRNEAVAALAVQPEGRYLDGTFGRGGHSRLILEHLNQHGRLLGFDKDPQAIETAHALAEQDHRFAIVQQSFASLAEAVTQRNWSGEVKGILLDLGVSSPQLDTPERGFSFLHDGPLDMRMNPGQGLSAAQWIAQASEEEISRVLKDYGEERFAKRMAKAVVARRMTKPFERTSDLAQVLAAANPAWERGRHPATRAFQGIRIHINNELADLEHALAAALEVLSVGGRLVVISFHSLEDRIVKHFMRRHAKGEADLLPRHLPIQSRVFEPRLQLIGKPQYASEQEVVENPRARSAIMRVAEKIR